LKGILTVCFHSMYHVHTLLGKHYPELKVWTAELGTTTLKKCDVLLIPSVAQFKRVKHRLAGKPVVVIIFDTPSHCVYVKPSTMLDARNTSSYKFVSVDLTDAFCPAFNDAWESAPLVKVNTKQLDVIPFLLNDTRPSLVSPLMGWLYQVKDGVSRFEYQKLIFTAIAEGSMDTAVAKIAEKEPKAVMRKLAALLETDKTLRLTEVIQAVVTLPKPYNYKKLSKQYDDVDMFDLKYFFKTYRKVQLHHDVDKDFSEIFDERKTTAK
jgi:hypothetical protein